MSAIWLRPAANVTFQNLIISGTKAQDTLDQATMNSLPHLAASVFWPTLVNEPDTTVRHARAVWPLPSRLQGQGLCVQCSAGIRQVPGVCAKCAYQEVGSCVSEHLECSACCSLVVP